MSEFATELRPGAERRLDAHVWQREANDHYVEPAWCSERLFATALFRIGTTVHDPACGFGTIPEAAERALLTASGSDIVPRWRERAPEKIDSDVVYTIDDFLNARNVHYGPPAPDAIVSNPPFKDAEAFARKALLVSGSVVALLLPTKWIQGSKRSKWLASTPLAQVLCLCPRPSMPPGHVIAAGGKPGNGTVDFSWFIWKLGHVGPATIGWLHRDPAEAA